MGQSIFELSLVYEVRAEEGAISFCSWQGGEVVPYGAEVYNLVGVDDESLRREDEVLVDVGGDNDGGVGLCFVFDIEETISDRSAFLVFSVKVQVVLGRLEPREVRVVTAVDHI